MARLGAPGPTDGSFEAYRRPRRLSQGVPRMGFALGFKRDRPASGASHARDGRLIYSPRVRVLAERLRDRLASFPARSQPSRMIPALPAGIR